MQIYVIKSSLYVIGNNSRSVNFIGFNDFNYNLKYLNICCKHYVCASYLQTPSQSASVCKVYID